MGLCCSWTFWALSTETLSPKRPPDLTMHVHTAVLWEAIMAPCLSYLLSQITLKAGSGERPSELRGSM